MWFNVSFAFYNWMLRTFALATELDCLLSFLLLELAIMRSVLFEKEWHIGSKGEAKCRRSIAWSVAWFSVRMMDGLLTREEKGKHRIPFSNNHYSR
ncbi:hypothetical protein V6Z11_A13G050300 [Gossypium hirsutum]